MQSAFHGQNPVSSIYLALRACRADCLLAVRDIQRSTSKGLYQSRNFSTHSPLAKNDLDFPLWDSPTPITRKRSGVSRQYSDVLDYMRSDCIRRVDGSKPPYLHARLRTSTVFSLTSGETIQPTSRPSAYHSIEQNCNLIVSEVCDNNDDVSCPFW